jgi:photosystem II stability/assembly factor-like uncharacterized protein
VWQNLPQAGRLNSTCFIDASHGWAVGEAGTILATTDGGAIWTAQSSGIVDGALNGVSFAGASNGWVVGDAGTILATTDGGATWTAQCSGIPDAALTSVTFVDASHGWAVGDAGTILATTDGGATWAAQDSGISGFSLNAVSFTDASHGWAVGGAAVIVATTDGGDTWTAQSSGVFDGWLNGVSFADASNGWAVGVDYGDGVDYDPGVALILATTDGGATWTAQSSGISHGWLYSVSCTDASHVWAVGEDGGEGGDYDPGAAAILATTDGGATWTAQSSGISYGRLNGVSFADASHGWAVGEDSDSGAAVILATTDGSMPPSASPAIAKIRPRRGRVGAIVTIVGSNFGASPGTSEVLFRSRVAIRYTFWSDTKIKVRVPRLAKGRKVVRVKTANGRSNAGHFRVL